MLRNYFKIAWRNLVRNKMFSLINVLGVTIGITCSCLLYLFIHDELNQDGFHKKSDRIFRVVEIDNSGNDTRYYGQTAPPVAAALKKDYPEVAATTRLFQPFGHLNTEIKGERLHERNYFMAESNFFELFDFEFTQGQAETCLSKPNSVVITEQIAEKYFGDRTPMGEIMEFDNYNDAIITAVIKDLPGNSHLQFDLLINGNSEDSTFLAYNQNWSQFGAFTYLLLNQPEDVKSLQTKSAAFAARYWPNKPDRSDLQFQNIQDIYFKSSAVEFGPELAKGEVRYTYLFGAIALFLLIIACINYINLATAKSGQRAREIGIRKTSGAQRWQLIVQFLSESMIIALIAFFISLGLVKVLLPFFNQITEKEFLFNLSTVSNLAQVLLVITLVIGLLSGLYPALYLSSLDPSKTVKGEIKTSLGSLYLRQGLVITQFALSIVMIVATVIANNQMNFISDRNLGFNHKAMAVVDINNGNVRNNFETMKYEFAQIPGVKQVAASSRVPGEWKNLIQLYASSDALLGDSLQTYFMSFDEDMIPTYGMEIVEGRNFSGNRLSDSATVLINQQAADLLGLDDPIGKDINISQVGNYRVIGVLKGFHYQSLHEDLAPLIIASWSNVIQSVDYFSLNLADENLSQTIAAINGVHEKFDNTTVMEMHFLDQQLERFYQADKRAQSLFTLGAVLTVFIACLGLFGLASFIIQRRSKEISIRKVLGASVMNLFLHISRSFVKQIMIAFIIAVPIAWIVMRNWLSYFAFKVDIGVGEFILALGLALSVGLLTVGHRAIKAALINPAHTLKND